jgi:hypothetical protein
MRDLISKLDAIVSETSLKDQDDLKAKRQALDDLESDPTASKDPEISAAIDQRRADLEREAKAKGFSESFEIGDAFGISFSEDHEIATEIVDILEDGIVIELDDTAIDMLTNEGLIFLEGEVVNEEKKKGTHGKACWKGYRRVGQNDCVKIGESGLQRYTGIKKYGKDGFEALQKAGREGADEEEKGRIKDKFLKKEDHGPENPNAPVNYGEYDREGDMAKDDLRTIDNAAEELYSILQSDDNLPEWVQSKITKAVDYLDTARDYMKAQKYEEGSIEEYGDTAKGQKMLTKVHKRAVDRMIKADDKRDAQGAKKNQQSANRAWDRFGEKEKYGEGVAEGFLNEVTQGVEHSEWVDNVKDHYYPTPVKIVKKRTEDGRHIGSYAMISDKKVGQYNMNTGVGTFTSRKNQGVAEGDVDEAKYQGREVPLGKKMAGDVKKSKVYVRKPNGNIVKVNFGDKKMRIKKSNPARRKSFRARHNCKNPGPRWKARYWSCRSW